MLSASLAYRETKISKSSERLISPRSNIQWAAPDNAMLLVRISGLFASVGLMWAASTSAPAAVDKLEACDHTSFFISLENEASK